MRHRVYGGRRGCAQGPGSSLKRRPGKNWELLKLAHEIAELGIKIRYDLIIDNPYDTEETLKETIDLLLKLPKPLRLNLYALQIFPNYPLTQKAIEDGHITRQQIKVNPSESESCFLG